MSEADIVAAQILRAKCFGLAEPRDVDPADARCDHILITDIQSGQLVCCFRMLELCGSRLEHSYSAQHYDLAALAGFPGRMLEIGRFCIDPDVCDPDVLRLAWAVLTAYVDHFDIRLLFGCTSFKGCSPARHTAVFARLKAQHLAPQLWAPGIKSRDVFSFALVSPMAPVDQVGLSEMPTLLRTYLTMGAWVSDHAVIDARLDTLHVFTGLEIDAIPPARKRVLRAL